MSERGRRGSEAAIESFTVAHFRHFRHFINIQKLNTATLSITLSDGRIFIITAEAVKPAHSCPVYFINSERACFACVWEREGGPAIRLILQKRPNEINKGDKGKGG